MKKKHIVLIHVIFWIYIFNQSLFPIYIKVVESKYLRDVTIETLLNMISFYSLYFLIPFFFKHRIKLVSVLVALVLIGACTGLLVACSFLTYKYIIRLPEKDLVINSVFIFYELRAVIIVGIYAVLINFTIGWFRNQKLQAELTMQKQTSELALLRSQVNPHFLFNTLNNIYSLVYRKSDDAPEAVLKLSEIMRYMLYDSNTDKVSLEEEITYLRSFIELQSLRIHDKNYVEFNISGNSEGFYISPMLLISFVENAFKHGSKNVARPGIIINLTVDTYKMIFVVTNFVRKNESSKDASGGIGLQNIKRRLELLYPGKHSLDTSSNENMYIIRLEIER
jgi:LytS/YehU family sensor histidine kinase